MSLRRIATGRPPRFPAAAALLLCAVLLAALSASRAIFFDRTARPDILIVVVDTLRQDRVGAYGYERPTTPHLDGLATQGTLYAEARSTSGWTVPAHASLFTGLYAAAHGATQEHWSLREDLLTVAEVLRPQGYRTIGGVGNPMLAASRGFAQGFEEYGEAWRGSGGRAPTTDLRNAAWLAQRFQARDERPQMAFVNLIGIHNPYDSCAGHCGAFGADLEDGPTGNRWRPYYLGRWQPGAASLERLSRLYDAEVRQADEVLGRVVEEFRRAAGGRPTLVIVTSDHGENLGEHGHLDHAFSLHESIVRVPLVVVGPDVAAGAVDRSPVQLHDVFPTVLRAAGIDPAEHPSQGLPLTEVPPDRAPIMEYYVPVQALRSLAEIATEAERPRLSRWQRRTRAVVQDGWKLIWNSDGDHEIYDLRGDPGERRDRSVAMTGTARRRRLEKLLQDRVAELARGHGARHLPGVDEETRRALRALGYAQ